MNESTINPERITDRLTFFNYRYTLEGTTLTIYLSMLCCLKIKFGPEKVKMTQHILWRPSFFGRLEYSFFIYGLAAFLLSWLLPVFAKGIVIFYGVILIYLLVCFIKTENMKSIIHNWIERDSVTDITGDLI